MYKGKKLLYPFTVTSHNLLPFRITDIHILHINIFAINKLINASAVIRNAL